MKRESDPLRLDVAALAKEQAELTGGWPVATLQRLAEVAPPDAPPGAAEETVNWRLRGETRPRRGSDPEIWLHIAADAAVWLQCQRCLQPMREPLLAERSFRFVRSEAEAEAEDPDSEEDVLVISRALDARALVEDELILALPLVPRHEVCPEPLPLPNPEPVDDGEEPAPNPFASLAVLKRGGTPH